MSQGTLPAEQLTAIVKRQLKQSIAVMQSVLEDPQIAETVAAAAERTAQAMKQGRKLMVAGNGGSAADSQHLVAEFVSRLTVDRPALPAIALTVDTSILTAIGNDYDYQNVFERQIEALGQRGDVFFALSTSGNSKNVIKGLHRARQMGIATIGYSGNGGGRMTELCDYSIVVPSSVTMNIQEAHIALEHIFCMLVEKCYFGPDFGETRPAVPAE
ncbi:D-sedoheptulose 7-phosphate isomerase [Occallatibacter riparius]|uniref:Phosphoheptose isomerase n=1 Tax=Occallatibacter riparius TaxID=1002689 RepID=A0A9J7BVW8_9BACT|nr:D-sedoheptulose 7-phosphate isomerase [Occallatibacter riparius]UWZ87012.1 D-sedoheptulose 7-phosphate isomerase [Occallatibacter riparius]